MYYIALSFMARRKTLGKFLSSLQEIDNSTWDAAGFKAWIKQWEGIIFFIFIIQQNKKDLFLKVIKNSNHAIVEGAPTLYSKKYVKMDLIGIAKKLSNQNIINEYNIEVFSGTKHEKQAVFLKDLC